MRACRTNTAAMLCSCPAVESARSKALPAPVWDIGVGIVSCYGPVLMSASASASEVCNNRFRADDHLFLVTSQRPCT